MIGFRVEPRNDSPVLSQLGLEPGDVLTEVNGKKLGDLRNVTEVLQTLQESPQANVMVRRNGVDQPRSIDIAQIARFAAGLGIVERVDVLPFHQMGKFKWAKLHLPYTLADTEPPGAALIERVVDVFRREGLTAY